MPEAHVETAVDDLKVQVKDGSSEKNIPNKEFADDNGNNNNDDISDDDMVCGLGPCRPQFLQSWARIATFTAVNSFAYTMMSMLGAYVSSQITTLERQFDLSSTQTAQILTANKIIYIICVLLASYVGAKVHIPRILSFGVLIAGVSAIICALPHFIYGPKLIENVVVPNVIIDNDSAITAVETKSTSRYGELCILGNVTVPSCDGESETSSELQDKSDARAAIAQASMVIIVIGMMLSGIGRAPRFSYSVTYVDNNTAKTSTGFQIGITITVSLMAPFVAYLLGSLLSGIYVTLEPTTLTPRHPDWVGAWWLGFLVLGFITILASIPLQCFPRRLPGTKRNSEKNEVQRKLSHASTQQRDWDMNVFLHKALEPVKHCLRVVFRLWTNPTYTLMNISAVLIIFSVSGQAYSPKYLERVFDMPAYKANLALAIMTLVSKCFGTFIGGYLTKRFKMTAYGALKFTNWGFLATLLTNMAGFLLYCDQPVINNRPGETTDCLNQCQCSDNSYFPVCGQDGKTYYSPCQAGCLDVGNGAYINCSCIPGGTAVQGLCGYQCGWFYAYVAFACLSSLFQTMTIMPKIVVFIRSVRDEDKTVAIGFHSFTTSLLGWLLGAQVFGVVIDGICDIWKVSCGNRGRCLLYDNDLLRIKMHGYSSVANALALLFVFLAYLYARCTGSLQNNIEPATKISTNQKAGDNLTLEINNDGEPLGDKITSNGHTAAQNVSKEENNKINTRM